MTYNNGFPITYQQYYPQYQQVQSPQLSQPQSNMNNGIIWVQGEAGAKSYLVAPNTTVQLWDSESQTIYLKSADASGMPSIKTLDYTIRELPSQTHQNAPETHFATIDDIDNLRNEIAQIRKEVKSYGKSVIPIDEKSAEHSEQHNE